MGLLLKKQMESQFKCVYLCCCFSFLSIQFRYKIAVIMKKM